MKPVIADRKPKKVTVEAGKDYYWCACGRSKNQPFCDGSHAGTSFSPKKFSPSETGDVYLCMCKQTRTAPHCDGTHQSLETPVDLLYPDATVREWYIDQGGVKSPKNLVGFATRAYLEQLP